MLCCTQHWLTAGLTETVKVHRENEKSNGTSGRKHTQHMIECCAVISYISHTVVSQWMCKLGYTCASSCSLSCMISTTLHCMQARLRARNAVHMSGVTRVYCDKTKAPSKIMTNRKSTASFPVILRWTAYVASIPQRGLKSDFVFPIKNGLLSMKVCYKVSLCENFQRQSYKAFTRL